MKVTKKAEEGGGGGGVEEENRVAQESQVYEKGVRHLQENGVKILPNKYIFPLRERPDRKDGNPRSEHSIRLPTVDLGELQGPDHPRVIRSIAEACEKYGFFQVTNHGIPRDVLMDMIDVSAGFFELPFEERARYMSPDMFSPVRYGTSMNQKEDSVLCWRDFLKITCQPTISDVSLRHWPSSPADFRKKASTYAEETKHLFLVLMEAVLEGLLMLHKSNQRRTREDDDEINDDVNNEIGDVMGVFKSGSQLMVMNCYPPCPEPNLTFGMTPHSDYGFLTLLLQDEVKGLQIQCGEKWVTVDPVPGTFVVNVGDHLEIFSNGRYRSVLHRVLTNSAKSRVSVVSIHSFPFDTMVRPWQELIDDVNPQRYKDTSFACFLDYLSSCEPKAKNFLESRKLSL